MKYTTVYLRLDINFRPNSFSKCHDILLHVFFYACSNPLVICVSFKIVLLISYNDNQELDFLNEAKNSIKCMDNFRRLSPHIADYVYAPKVYWNLSTTKLLTMEFVEGAEVNDLQSIQKLGINPHDIARLVSIFSLYYQLG